MMKFAIPTAALFLLLGMTASTYAMQEKEKRQDQHQQEAKPAQKEARPAQQHPQQQSKMPQRQRAENGAKPAQQQQQHAQQQQQHPQQAERTQRQQTPDNRAERGNDGRQQERAQQSNRENENRGGHEHGRIPDDRYRSSFGREHRFHVDRDDYQHRRFQYGGYTFGFIDPWPVGWAYSDDVYVEYVDGGYYMYDPVHPGLRISISIQ